MPIFTYTARNQQGDIVSGSLDALNVDAAEEALREMNLVPDQVYQSMTHTTISPDIHDHSPEYKSPWEDSTLEKELDNVEDFSFEDAVAKKVPQELTQQPIEPLEENDLHSTPETPDPVRWTPIDEDNLHEIKETHTPLPALSPHLENSKSEQNSVEKTYYPLSETLRLYAGWLLAWYGIVYALGHYESTRSTTLEIPYVQGLLLSPLVLTFTLAAFLFLLFSTISRKMQHSKFNSFFCTFFGICTFILYRMNV